VTPPVPHEFATRAFQRPYESLAVHTSSSSGCRSAVGGAGTRSCVTINS
jgi:hypothetical protein